MPLAAANRLRVLHETRLLDSPPERAFDRLTRLAAGLIGAPTALVSLVDDHRQFFKSAIGLGEPWASKRETPLSYSFCQYVVRDKAPLVVNDARKHDLVKDSRAVGELGVAAYAGMPLVVGDQPIGALCVVDTAPRQWTPEQLALLADLAESVVSEIELRMSLHTVEQQRALVNVVLDSLSDGVLAVGRDRRVLAANASARRLFTPPVVGERMTNAWRDAPRSMRADGGRLTPQDDELGRALRGESTDNFDFSIESPTGDAIRLEASARPVYDSTGNLIAAVGVYRDTTAKHAQAALYTTLAKNIPRGAVMLFDSELRCLAIDGGLARRRGVDQRSLVGRNLAELVGMKLDSPAFAEARIGFHRTLGGESLQFDIADGPRILQLRTAPVHDALGGISSGFLIALDVTDDRKAQYEVKKSEQVYRAITQNIPDLAVLLVDPDLRFVTAQGPVLQRGLGGLDPSTLVGKTVGEVATDQNRAMLVELYRSVFEGQSRSVEFRSNDRFYDLSTAPIYDANGVVSHALISMLDVTRRKAELMELETARKTLEAQARALREDSVTDSLTGLLNRRGFSIIADNHMKAAVRAKRELLLFFVDLNGMKAINDTLGHAVGDQALVETGQLLRGVFRACDAIARLGGDEFVVLATEAASSSAKTMQARLMAAVDSRNETPSPFKLSISIGVSVFDPAQPCTLDQLLSQADERMYVHKQTGRNARFGGPPARQ